MCCTMYHTYLVSNSLVFLSFGNGFYFFFRNKHVQVLHFFSKMFTFIQIFFIYLFFYFCTFANRFQQKKIYLHQQNAQSVSEAPSPFCTCAAPLHHTVCVFNFHKPILEICRSRKHFSSCVNLSRKQHVPLQNLLLCIFSM